MIVMVRITSQGQNLLFLNIQSEGHISSFLPGFINYLPLDFPIITYSNQEYSDRTMIDKLISL